MTVNKIIRNDYGFTMTFTITDSDGTAVDLTSVTDVYFKMALPGASACKVKGSCTVTDATGGICTYTPVSTDFDTNGVYNQEVELQFATRIITASGEQLSVVEDLPAST